MIDFLSIFNALAPFIWLTIYMLFIWWVNRLYAQIDKLENSIVEVEQSIELHIAKLTQAIKLARLHGITSDMFDASEALKLAVWVDQGVNYPLPEITSPFVLDIIARNNIVTEASALLKSIKEKA